MHNSEVHFLNGSISLCTQFSTNTTHPISARWLANPNRACNQWWITMTKNCLLWLAIVNPKDCHFKFYNLGWDGNVLGGQTDHLILFTKSHSHSHLCSLLCASVYISKMYYLQSIYFMYTILGLGIWETHNTNKICGFCVVTLLIRTPRLECNMARLAIANKHPKKYVLWWDSTRTHKKIFHLPLPYLR